MKTTKVLLLAILSLLISDINSQTFQWAKVGGEPGGAVGNNIAVDAQGNSYVTGYFLSTANFDGIVLTSAGGQDIYVAKYNTNGVIQWVLKAGGIGDDAGNDISLDASGDIYVTGKFHDTATFGSSTFISSGNTDVFVAKCNSAGQWLWAIKGGSTDWDEGYAISTDNTGNSYITGYIRGTSTFGNSTVNVYSGASDILIAKCNSNGEWIWADHAGGGNWDFGNGISIDGDENIYITGYFQIDYSIYFGSNILYPTANSNMFVAKYNSAGNNIWAVKGGGPGHANGADIATDADGNSYVLGIFYDTASFNGVTLIAVAPEGSWWNDDYFFAKYDSDGNLKWIYQLGGAGYFKGNGVTLGTEGEVFITGTFDGTVTIIDTTLTSSGYDNMYVALFDTAGTFYWVKKADGNYYHATMGISDGTGNAYITGFFGGTATFNCTTFTAGWFGNMFITKLNDFIHTGNIAQTGFCPGETVMVPFTSEKPCNPQNVYTAQLSDITGCFNNPVNIGTLNYYGTGGIITAAITQNTTNGTTYRIRVISSDPLIIGADNGTNLTIYPVPVADAGADTTIIAGDSIQIGSSPVSGYTYLWSPSTGLSSTTVAQSWAKPDSSITYYLTVTNGSGCIVYDSIVITTIPNCGFDSLVNKYSKLHPEYFENLKLFNQAASEFIYGSQNNGTNNPKTTIALYPPANYVIPVVVHVMHPAGEIYGNGTNISYAQIESQIDALNAAFAMAYSNGYNNGQTHSPWAQNTGIQFCLARTTMPSTLNWYNGPGGTEFGVMRYGVSNAITNTTFDATGAQSLMNITHPVSSGNFPFQNYLNIWLVQSISGNSIIGYATNPLMMGWPLDGVVIRDDVIGDNTTGNNFVLYNTLEQGKILSHEVGHYLNLEHIFNNGCAGMNAAGSLTDPCDLNGDFICDIEPCTTQHVNDCSTPYETCTANYNTGTITNDMIESYMSYADDNCMNTFTNDQSLRMIFTLNTQRSQLWTTINLSATGIIGNNGCIAPYLIPDIIVNQSVICQGQSLFFSNPTQGNTATQWNWTFTGGNPANSTSQNVTVQYVTPGTYIATLVVSDGTLQQTQSINIFVTNCSINPANLINQANWYFGSHCAVSFATGTPIATTPSSIYSQEACASISDNTGNLLFYTNGVTVWNSQHNSMTNFGGVLAGSLNSPQSVSSAQGALIVHDPGDQDKYYIFTAPDAPGNNLQDVLRFTIIDMTLNAGLGEIASINQQVPGPSINISEQLCAIPHCNGRDYWVIAHGASVGFENQLLAYLVTPFGILQPVYSNSGYTIPVPGNTANSHQYIGHFDAARNGNSFAASTRTTNNIYFYTFDNANGTFVLESTVASFGNNGGISFSPNSRFLYLINGTNLLRQIDIQNISNPIVFSTTLTSTPAFYAFEPIQLGPDGLIYVGRQGFSQMGVIAAPDNPNNFGSPNACGITPNGPVLLNGQGVTIGFPNMIDALPNPVLPVSFTYTFQTCTTVEFTVDHCWQMYTATWNFGDGTPVVNGTTVTHDYTTDNNYIVTLTFSILGNNLPSVTQNISIIGNGTLSITGPNTICPNITNGSIYSVPGNPLATYNWTISANGTIIGPDNTNQIIVVWNSGTVGTINVTVTLPNCVRNATLNVNILPAPIANAGTDVTICSGLSTTLGASGGISYSWSPSMGLSSTTIANPVANPTTTTTYTVVVTDINGCTANDQVTVTVTNCCYGTLLTTYNGQSSYPDISSNPTIATIVGDCSFPSSQISIAINGTLYVNTQFLTFDKLNVWLGEDAKIIIQPGCTLKITGAGGCWSWLHACEDMWDYINVGPGATLIIDNGTIIEDAEIAVRAHSGGTYSIENSMFKQNYKHIRIISYAPSVPTGTITGTSFICPATLKPPRTGTKTYMGIEIIDVGKITIGDPAKNPNIFKDSYYGIYMRTTQIASIDNNKFLTGVNYYSPYVNVEAIHYMSAPGNSILNVGVNFKNVFKDWMYGVYVTHGPENLNVYNNKFNDMLNYAVFVTQCTGNNITVYNNDISWNNFGSISTVPIGIRCYVNPTATINISLNKISQTGSNINQYARGIWVQDLTPVPGTIVNITENISIKDMMYGIKLENIYKSYIFNNTVNLLLHTTPWPDGSGIFTQGCYKPQVIKNRIKSNYTLPAVNKWLSGIRIDQSDGAYVICNQTEKVGVGLLSGGTMPFTHFNNNAMSKDHYIGFMQNTGYIWTQGMPITTPPAQPSLPSDNTWAINGTNFVYHTYTYNPSLQIQFLVRNQLGTKYYPNPMINVSNWGPLLAVLPVPTTGTSGISCPKASNSKQLAIAIAKDSLQFSVNPSLNKKLSKLSLYNTMKVDSTFSNDGVLIQFRDSTRNTAYGMLDSVSQSMIIPLDTNFAKQLSLFNSSITATDSISLLLQTVNDIALRRIAINDTAYTVNEINTLKIIAQLCPYYYRDAVYMARVILSSIDNSIIDYYNSCEMASSDNNMKEIQANIDTENLYFKLYPNPTNDEVTIEMIKDNDSIQSIRFEVYSLVGDKLLSVNLSNAISTISTKELCSGVYYCRVILNNDTVINDKLIIIK